jgi:hypothetical protein
MRIIRRSVRRDVLSASTFLAILAASPPAPIAVDSVARLTSQATNPDFGPNVTIFDPTTPAATIQAKLDAVFKRQESSEFGDARFALLFKPGTYDVDARVGFYTQLSGLGLSPDDVVINGGVRADARWRKGNATLNFWRIAENMSVNPDSGFNRWAVSQAAPMRRMHIRGDLVLDDGGWSSGGFLADSKIDGQVRSGSQQQWLTRGSELGGWKGSNWNMVFVGTRNAPPQSFPDPPYTTLASAPVIREKPFLYVDARGAWRVFVPAFRPNASGTTWSEAKAPGVSHPIGDFVIVKPGSAGSSVAAMNDVLARGKNLMVTPGIYHLDAPLRVTHANTIVLGLGLATLVADHGASAIAVDDVDGVIVAGLLIEAGATNSPILIQVGPPGASANHSSNPTLLSDVFVRVGGAGVGKATQSVQINSNDVIGDHLWLWRADHGAGVGWTSNTAANGLVVNGNHVVMYGLFVEHYQQHQVRWNGNGGRTYFFQNEMPYDVPDQVEWMDGTTKGFGAYQVAASVTSHDAWGLGSYCFFNRNPSVVADHAFEAPVAPNVRFHDMVIVSLGGGKGSILHVINGTGSAATAGATVQKLVVGPLPKLGRNQSSSPSRSSSSNARSDALTRAATTARNVASVPRRDGSISDPSLFWNHIDGSSLTVTLSVPPSCTTTGGWNSLSNEVDTGTVTSNAWPSKVPRRRTLSTFPSNCSYVPAGTGTVTATWAPPFNARSIVVGVEMNTSPSSSPSSSCSFSTSDSTFSNSNRESVTATLCSSSV